MSLDVLTKIWRAPPCKSGDLLCLLAIADNADEYGFAWPSMQTIARKAAMSERGARKCIRNLQKMGVLSVKIGGGRGGSNAYQINFACLETRNNCAKPGTPVPEQSSAPPGTPVPPPPEQSCHKPGTPVPPNRQEPSKNPHRGEDWDRIERDALRKLGISK